MLSWYRVEPSRQTLMYTGSPLNDGNSLAYHGIGHEYTLSLGSSTIPTPVLTELILLFSSCSSRTRRSRCDAQSPRKDRLLQ
jgi:hypothetical protein